MLRECRPNLTTRLFGGRALRTQIGEIRPEIFEKGITSDTSPLNTPYESPRSATKIMWKLPLDVWLHALFFVLPRQVLWQGNVKAAMRLEVTVPFWFSLVYLSSVSLRCPLRIFFRFENAWNDLMSISWQVYPWKNMMTPKMYLQTKQ